MNKKFFFSCFICIFTIFLSATFYFNKQTVIESENRFVTAFPQLPEKYSTSKIKHFFKQLSSFYTDNFPNREKIILTLTALIPSIKSENLSYDNVIIGKDDWLFLGNNDNNTVDKLTGKLYYHDTDYKKFDTTTRYNYYKNIADKILTQNKSIFFLIGPNKSSVYPEFLPNKIIPAAKPFHAALTQKMQEEGLNLYYPREDIIQAKSKDFLYFVTDTHWNNYGAFIAFINLLPQLDSSFSSILKKEDISFEPLQSIRGDLSKMGNFIFKEKDYHDNFKPLYKNTPLTTPHAVETENKETSVKHIYNPDALTDKTVWIIGDSFSIALQQYFTLFFKNYYFVHNNTFNPSAMKDYKEIHADYVIFEYVERRF